MNKTKIEKDVAEFKKQRADYDIEMQRRAKIAKEEARLQSEVQAKEDRDKRALLAYKVRTQRNAL